MIHLRYLFIGAATSIFAMAAEFERVTRRDPFSDELVESHVALVLGVFRVTAQAEGSEGDDE